MAEGATARPRDPAPSGSRGPSPAAAVAAGDWRALRRVVRGFVASRVSRPEDVDDIVSEVLLRLLRHEAAGEGHGRLDAWIHRVARHAIIDHYRAQSRAPLPLGEQSETIASVDLPTARAEPADSLRADLAACLRALAETLPPHEREALLLTDLGELSQVEAAHHVGISVSGMKSRVQRGRQRLAQTIRACCAITLDARGAVLDMTPHDPCACAPERRA